MQERPNNRFKGPFLALIAVVGLFDAVLGIVSGGPWWVVVLGLLVFVVAIALWRFVRQGRNPWWLRAPLDPK
jgi:protein-S-isoprenylcysteine O-methyltransferase Ste14